MLLAIDVGNTHTVLGCFDGERLAAEWRVPTGDHRTPEEIAGSVSARLIERSIAQRSVDRVGISSVVPALTNAFDGAARALFGVDPVVISAALDLGIKVRYNDPLAVGADRLCNAVAGYAKYGGPLIIVDYGTATTYDVVGSSGDYLGGVIAPGVETSAADLHRRAARLPSVSLDLPDTLVGQNTTSSMQTGILYGAIDATVGMVRRLKEHVTRAEGRAPTVIATGGFSAFMAAHTDVLDHREPSLVLDGIRLIVLDQTSRR